MANRIEVAFKLDPQPAGVPSLESQFKNYDCLQRMTREEICKCWHVPADDHTLDDVKAGSVVRIGPDWLCVVVDSTT